MCVPFFHHGFKVQEYWVAYTEKVDRMVEVALQRNIKDSMKKLSRAINGDSKSSPNPLFKILVALRQTTSQTTPKVVAINQSSIMCVWMYQDQDTLNFKAHSYHIN